MDLTSQSLSDKDPNMKTLAVIILIVIGSWEAHALDVILQWDAAPEEDLDHYTLYEATKGVRTSGPWQEVAQIPKDTPTHVRTVPDQGNFTWYVTASDVSGNESQASNTVDLYDKTAPLHIKNLRKAEPQP